MTGRPGSGLSVRRVGVLAAAVLLAGCGGGGAQIEGDAVARGETLFANNCAVCHGEAGVGTTTGPPLVHEIYEPGHHSDESFHRAVAEGVDPHHWDFGPMMPIPGLDTDEVDDIIAYVRMLQREAGIE